MKKNSILILSVISLLSFVGLSSCNNETTSTVTDDKTYSLSLNAQTGTKIEVVSKGDSEGKFKAGEEVEFKVTLDDPTLYEVSLVTINDVSLAVEEDGTYLAIMPGENAIITTACTLIGDVPDKAYSLTVTETQGVEVEILSAPIESNQFIAGSEVKLSVNYDEDLIVLNALKVNGVEVNETEGIYSFTMPNQDSVITTEVTTLGDGSLLNITEVNDRNLATITTSNAVRTLIEDSADLEALYLNSAHLEFITTENSENYEYDYTFGSNDVMIQEGIVTPYTSSDINEYHYDIYGILNDERYYSIEEEGNFKSFDLREIVEEGGSSTNHTINRSEAETNLTANLSSQIISEAFNSTYPLDYQFTSDDITLNDERTIFTLTMTGDYYSSYSGYRVGTLTVSIDGDGVLHAADFVLDIYESSSYDEENDTLIEDPILEDHEEMHLTATRGYKKELTPKYDIHDYVLSDYDVRVNQSLEGTNKIMGEDNRVDNGSLLSFTYHSNVTQEIGVSPWFVGVDEGENDFVELNYSRNPTVQKEGTFHLLFDNGLGEIKKIEVTSVQPTAGTLNVSLSNSSMFVGGSITLSASLTPSTALQDVNVTLRDDSTCEANITKNDDGTYTITGNTAGTGTLVVTSVSNPSLVREVAFEVREAPDYNTVYAFMTQNTLSSSFTENSTYAHTLFINFNTDGTGEFFYTDDMSGFASRVGDIETFTWTLDETTFAIDIPSYDGTDLSCGYNFASLTVSGNNSIEVLTEYQHGSTQYPSTLAVYGESKVELSTIRSTLN